MREPPNNSEHYTFCSLFQNLSKLIKIDHFFIKRNAFFNFKITMSPLGNTPEFSVHRTCLFSLPAFYKNYLKTDQNLFQNKAFFRFKITMSPLGNTPEFSVHQTCLFSLPAFYKNYLKNDDNSLQNSRLNAAKCG